MSEDKVSSVNNGSSGRLPRSVALVGPQASGKSTLFEAMLPVGSGRRSAGRDPGTEMRLRHGSYLGDPWALLDTPGAVDFAYDAGCALAVADAAVVVCDADLVRAMVVGPLFHQLEEAAVPTVVFINKVDALTGTIRDMLAALQAETRRRLVLRQVPIREAGAVTGYVDVVSGRAYRYRRGAASEQIETPETLRPREAEARGALLEALVDHDDELFAKVVEDLEPTPDEIYRPLHRGEASGAVISVLLGAAEYGYGIRRLWKTLRHDVPDPGKTATQRGIPAEGPPLVQVFRTRHGGHAGRLSFARVWRGPLADGTTIDSRRVGGLHRFPDGEAHKVARAETGDLVAIGRLEGVATGATLGGPALDFPAPPPPVYALAIGAEDRKEEVRLSVALQRLAEEDLALSIRQDADSAETILAGQGELHLRTAVDRLLAASGVRLQCRRPQLPLRETIRHAVVQHARLKRQTGGHGQFADVKLQIAPRPRGTGFHFGEKVVGGTVPRRFIPAVAQAAEAATREGPLGHPVVDVAVTLLDGGFHSVDSSDMAFATATRMAMQEGLAKAEPVLLEPYHQVTVAVPATFTANVQRLLSGRRGQILGFAGKPGMTGWDEVQALLPAGELDELIVELRSQTQGLGTYTHSFDHLAEARGR
ncbi:elongation factor G [Belnapia sp. T6]|uniref:Elongation factor G n=1 Tax=Belnapia mucosa TaxID=2804532 RepID=A0ABS1VCF6_9PROT|nr:elongation factor G [Belnapia mucosa]MBL6459355.1 elongation factor G [Belnapia mucosa]